MVYHEVEIVPPVSFPEPGYFTVPPDCPTDLLSVSVDLLS